jgi:hypothetical protein
VRVEAASASGLLYGAFKLLSLLQQHKPIPRRYESAPAMERRVWNLWDNVDRAGYQIESPLRMGTSSRTKRWGETDQLKIRRCELEDPIGASQSGGAALVWYQRYCKLDKQSLFLGL